MAADELQTSIPSGPLEVGLAVRVREPVFAGQVHVVEAAPGLVRLPSLKSALPEAVLVHGIGDGGADDWRSLMAHLSCTHRVLTFDLPGFHRSSRKNEHYSPDRYVKLIKFLTTQLGYGPFSLVGHSMGSALALLYAARYPNDVERLVLCSTPGILHRHAFGEQMVRFGIGEIPGLQQLTGGALERWAHNLVRPILRFEPNPALLFRLAKMRQKVLGGDPAKIAGLLLMLEDFGSAIERVAAAPLIIWGDQDTIAPLRTGKLLASRIPGARLEVLRGCGHVPMKERPGEFNRLVKDFLSAPPVTAHYITGKAPTNKSEREERYENEDWLRLAGEYGRLELVNCKSVMLRGVRAQSVLIDGCHGELENCQLGPSAVALEVRRSHLTLTGGELAGTLALHSEQSDLDLAGVSLAGTEAAIRSPHETKVLCSVCPVASPRKRGILHGIYVVGRGQDL